MSSGLSTAQCLQPLLAPAHSPPAAGSIVRITFGEFSGRVACVVCDFGAVACPYLLQLAPARCSTLSPDASAALVLQPPASAAASAAEPSHCRLDVGMFQLVRGAVTVGHCVELQQLLDRSAAKMLRAGSRVRLKGSARCGVVTRVSPRSATVQLRPTACDAAQGGEAAGGVGDTVEAALEETILRLKGNVVATRVSCSAATAAAQPLPSYQVQVATEAGEFWVEPFFLAVVLKQRQLQAFDALAAPSAHNPSVSLQLACSRGDAAALQVLLSSGAPANPEHFSPLITVLAANGSHRCITALLLAGCDPLKPYQLNLDDAARGANAAAAPSTAPASTARLLPSSYREAVAAGSKKAAAAAAAPQVAAPSASGTAAAAAAAAAARDSPANTTRTCCALDAAAYFGLLPAFAQLLEACKRKATLQHYKSCAAAAAAADQVAILQHLHQNVVGDADSIFWPEAAAVAAASDHCLFLQRILSLTSRSWMQPLNCSLAPCARSNVLHVAAARQSNRVIISCCNLARSSPLPLQAAADSKLLSPWAQLLRSADCSGRSPLHVAVGSACSDAAVAALVSCARDTLEAADFTGKTALLTACATMNLSAVKVLLSAGANRSASDASGQSAAAAAVAACSLQQAHVTDAKSRAALQRRCLDIIKLLSEPVHGPAAAAVPNPPTAPPGEPLIVAAARAGLDGVVAHLLDADPSSARAKGREGQTVLDVYLRSKSGAGLDMLQRRGLLSAVDYAAAPRRNAGFDPAHTLKPFWQPRR